MSASNSFVKAAERPLNLNPIDKGTAQSTANATKFGAKHDGSHMGTSHLVFVHGEHYLANASVYAAVKDWLANVIPALSLQHCIAAAKVALINGARLAELTCRHCNHPHLDE